MLKQFLKIIAFVGMFSCIGLAQAAELFSEAWMTAYKLAWNQEPKLIDKLAEKGFSSTIAYGFQNEDKPRGVLIVKNGKVVEAGLYNGEELNWDLRASKDNWKTWLTEGMTMGGLGWAYTTSNLKFKTGDYWTMIKNPTTAGPFVKSFEVMGRLQTKR